MDGSRRVHAEEDDRLTKLVDRGESSDEKTDSEEKEGVGQAAHRKHSAKEISQALACGRRTGEGGGTHRA